VRYFIIGILFFVNSCTLPRNNPLDGKSPVPSINTINTIYITQISAQSGGNITAEGATKVTARGVCWSTEANPTITLTTITNDGNGIGSFISHITGLNYNTKYYVRAYATNSFGTIYGNLDSFYTLSGTIPTLTTLPVTNIVGSSATCGGNITSDGGLQVTARGICYKSQGISDTNNNDLIPTINNQITSDGSGTGIFNSQMTQVYSVSGNFYVRAYATNAAGTAYGNMQIFYPNSQFYTGQNYEGGIIFSIDNTGNHGLIAAPYDQTSTLVAWGCIGTYIYNVNDASIMTDSIISECPEPNIAAKICKNLSINGYNDWYLPSYDELNLMRYSLSQFGIGNFNTTNSNYSRYLSSSQNNATSAYFENFYKYANSPIDTIPKNVGCNVRAVRSF